MSGRKFYWLKLKKDFFKRHDIRILEKMEDGQACLLLYIKLLCESLDHDGNLRFSDALPYTPAMLSAIMDIPEETVKKALKYYDDLGLVSTLEDGTIHMNHLDDMIGCETAWAEKKRQTRNVKTPLENEDNVQTMSTNSEDNVQTKGGQSGTMSDKRIENREKRKEIKRLDDKEREKERKNSLSPSQSKRFVAPSVEEVKAYCEERHNGIDAERFVSYYDSVGWKIGGKAPMKDWRAAIRNWERRQKEEPANRKGQDVPYMENEYTKEHLEQRERESLELLDSLLEE